MEIFVWIVGIIVAYIIFAIISGGNRERAYQRVIADLAMQMERDPQRFFKPYFNRSNRIFVDHEILTALLFEKVVDLSLQRNIRSSFNANIIPSDITTLVDAKRDFEELYNMALYELSMMLLRK
ncbi:hypothetical protein AO377_1856 [Moraxella catarrhalis]|uniref:hypothetical protein n=1 Tax=Moraxella catarrhalis TaxID=480 RepID=UPI0007E307D1|nr:hypothetical protein [Moraxella catarrhalis]OAV06321.1 hypothetical protein AO381_0300 [Moraxella catarrhalis]OAV08658.1 hypothetical protein AO377_1856 [Moraxella catarrhalis]OAV14222.1 hypothetical protein AO375_1337 [Moraxella catarrhalis]OAV34282.1 hypothetical protein AO365_1502 [Moraxella catarrhalis]